MADSKAVTTAAIVQNDEANTKTRASQASVKTDHHMDSVEVTISKDTKFYKKGQKDIVHPTVAAIFEEKGIIEKGWEKKIKRYIQPKVKDGEVVYEQPE